MLKYSNRTVTFSIQIIEVSDNQGYTVAKTKNRFTITKSKTKSNSEVIEHKTMLKYSNRTVTFSIQIIEVSNNQGYTVAKTKNRFTITKSKTKSNSEGQLKPHAFTKTKTIISN